MITQIIIFIVLIIIICVAISSIEYSSHKKEMYKGKDVKNKAVNMGNIRTEIINNCTIVNIKDIHNNVAYLLEGRFSNSCLSLYKNNERIHSRIVNGEKSLVLSSNLILTTQIFKISKYKSELLSLENGNDYLLSINNVNNINVKDYTVNYDINISPINYTYSKNIGLNEYDLIKDISDKYPVLDRYTFKNIDKENKWVFKNDGDFILILLNNLYNIDLTINTIEKHIRKTGDVPSYEIIPITNPNIVAFNLDYKSHIKGINKEYIDFITSPNHLMSKFLYGSKTKEIDFVSQINDKILIFKVKEV
jgi:hypothetical protein